MSNIQAPGDYQSREDADDLARKLVEGDTKPKAVEATAVAPKVDEEELKKPGPYGMTFGEWKALTPEAQWSRMLVEYKTTPDEARAMMRKILLQGYVDRTYKLWGGELKIRLRNPHGEHRLRVAREVDRLNNPTNGMVRELTDRLNLAGALLSYDTGEPETSKSFSFPKGAEDNPEVLDKLFDERLKFTGTIPPEVQPHIYVVLNHFTGLVTAALANGAVGSF